MAKRKTRKPARRVSRKRSVGAATSGMITDVLGLAVGAIVAKKADSMLPNLNPMIKNVAKIAIGVALPKFVKNPMAKAVGDGMIAVGAASLVGTVVPALGATDEVLVVSGVDEIGGVDEINGLSEVNGVDEIGEVEVDY